ncbi:MAG TPA: hypothetical protein PLG17_11845, partial [Thermodesulfobacteriota bacterium]|nr:hypothetical protein [Thermodesulfobacteriota bacterium]
MPELITSNYSKETFPELFTLRFGMTKAEVKTVYQKRGLKPIFERTKRLDFIYPPIDVPGATESNTIFDKDGHLIEVAQYFDVDGDDASAFKHIAKYRDLKDQLTAKYGTPECIEFMDDQYNNGERRAEGFKIKRGNYACLWRNVNRSMDVFLVLGGD